MIKLSNEEILKKLEKIEELDWKEIKKFFLSLTLTQDQMNFFANHENLIVRRILAKNFTLTEELMIKLANDKNWYVRDGLIKNPSLTKELIIKLASDSSKHRYINEEAFAKLEKLNSLKSENLQNTYDLIMKAKYISKKHFEKTFDYIADKFPELSEFAKIFKKLVLKFKKDLK